MGFAGGSTTGAGFEAGIGLMPGVELILGVLPYEWLFCGVDRASRGDFSCSVLDGFKSTIASDFSHEMLHVLLSAHQLKSTKMTNSYRKEGILPVGDFVNVAHRHGFLWLVFARHISQKSATSSIKVKR